MHAKKIIVGGAKEWLYQKEGFPRLDVINGAPRCGNLKCLTSQSAHIAESLRCLTELVETAVSIKAGKLSKKILTFSAYGGGFVKKPSLLFFNLYF